jgi:hypothetical protein
LLIMQRELNAMARDLAETVGDSAHIDGAFDKLLWRLHDRRFPLRLLPPYQGASEDCFDRLVKIIETKYRRWTPEG